MSASGNSLSADTKFTAHSSTALEVTANSAIAKRLCWLLTQPIDGEVLKRKGAPIDIKTVSHHQGHVDFPDRGSWSWFELAIVPVNAQVSNSIIFPREIGFTENAPIKINSNGQVAYDYVKKAGDKALAWFSHSHPVDQNGTFETFEHRFPDNHEIWTYLQVGDRLAVFGCAQYPNWGCYGRDVELKLGEGTSNKQTAPGTVTRVSTNRVSCAFVIDEFTLTFDATLTPSLPAFTSKTACIVYTDKDNLTGTYSFSGYFGKDDFKITIVDNDGTETATVSGELNGHLKTRNQVRGTGTWMSS
ncbi:hypothetical protein ACEPAH_9222 [Sanghuangporus vaninii]